MYLVAPVCPSVCQSTLSRLNPLTLIFGMRVDLDLGYSGIVGQGRRSKVKVKVCFKVMGQGQISGVQGLILGAQLCRVQKRVISPKCLSVC